MIDRYTERLNALLEAAKRCVRRDRYDMAAVYIGKACELAEAWSSALLLLNEYSYNANNP